MNKKEIRTQTPVVVRTKLGDFGQEEDWKNIRVNQLGFDTRTRLGNVPRFQLDNEGTGESRNKKTSVLSATCIKDMQYYELTNKLVEKYHPDKNPHDPEDIFDIEP